jgi:flagellar protein FlaG
VQRPDGEEALRTAIQAIDPAFNPDTSRLSIALDADLNRFIYRSIDKTTGEVIGQYPAEEILRAIKYLREVEGLVVDERA